MRTAGFLVFALALAGASHAQSSALAERPARMELAESLSLTIGELQSLLPLPKPDDKKWVEDEMRSISSQNPISMDRLRNFYMSKEYAHVTLHKLVTELRANLDCVRDQRKRLQEEVLCWAVAANAFSTDSQLADYVVTLTNAGVLPRESPKVRSYALDSRHIYSQIVIPYLEGKLK